MKAKFYLMMAVASFFMCNCSQEENFNQSQEGSNTLIATIEGSSRSAVTDGGVFSWTSGDAISVYNGTDFTTYTYDGSGNSFSTTETITPEGVAIYPANEDHVYADGATKVYLSPTYNYGSTNAPMLADVVGSTLAFKHLGGLMRFVVKEVPDEATSFTFTANSGITGLLDVTVEGEDRIISAAAATDNNKSVTISFEADEISDVMTFYIPLPVGAYEGYTVAIGGKSHTTDAAVVNTINRGTLLLMPTFTYDADAENLVKGTESIIVMDADEEVQLPVNDGEEVTVQVASDAVATLNLEAPANSDAVLTVSDGSGEDISQPSTATLNIAADNASALNINAPTLTVNLSSGEYDNVEALTATNTLVIKSGVTIANLTVKGGNVIIEAGATVGTIVRHAENTGKVYVVNNGTLTTAPSDANIIFFDSVAEMLLRAVAENSGTYQLQENIALTSPLVVSGNMHLDLNGYTLTSKNATLVSPVGINCTDALVLIRRNGHLTIFDESGTGNGRIDTGDNSSIMTAIKLTCAEDETGENVNVPATLTMTGGVIKGYYYGISGNGNRHGTTIAMEGGKIEAGYCADDNTGIFHPQDGMLNVNDGIIEGYKSAIEMRAGVLNIMGGTFKATSNEYEHAGNANGNSVEGAAIAISQHTTEKRINVDIAGGTFEGYYALYEHDFQGQPTEVTLNVHGGTFNGRIYSSNGGNQFIRNGIFSHHWAFKYLASGAEVTLGADIETSQTITIPADVTATINLGSYDITTDGVDAFKVEGNLTINANEDANISVIDPKSACAVWACGGAVTINGGHYSVGADADGLRNDCIYAGYNAENKGGTIVVNGGKFEYTGPASDENEKDGEQFLLNCADKAMYTAKITVNGGTFKNHVPSYEPVTPAGREDKEVVLGTGVSVYNGSTVVTAPHSSTEDIWYEVK